MRNTFLFCLACMLFLSCSSHKEIVLKYVDNYKIGADFNFENSKVGGISGIDFNPKNNTYFLVSDDRSEHNNARFYSVNIKIQNNKIDTVIFLRKSTFIDKNKNHYQKDQIDLESIRFNPNKNLILVGDEGGKQGKTSIKIFDVYGNFFKDFPLKKEYLANIRNNKSFESLSFSKDYQSLFYATEAPLLSDGDVASINEKGHIRIFESNFDNPELQKEYEYWLEKVPQKAAIQPPWKGTGSDNGLSEILYLNDKEFLTLERSGAYRKDGSFKYICKVFLTIIDKKSSKDRYHTIKKELVDFSKLPSGQFNVEGMTLGPIINQKQYILFVSDNNFRDKTPTIIYLFTMSYK
ncbi:esterase-like activity of phytase family protein [Polaribacter cellanae]|uniref:Esterase-like activity of phytase family protein n=1 Tax=Polaribacter cellanae TaxID=2818493 RepID=A0A975CMV1_9FLAO|nr:esterase-like activity of phytase family protein [Polaribacter cellanae]QTE22836.1 esterase-like activity of phytase family protein [Polaribacter cellanae]